MTVRGGLNLATGALPVLLAGACASSGSTLDSGVGDAFLERAPYYAGWISRSADAESARIGHLPVAYQPGASHPPIFEPSETGPAAELVDHMTRYLDSLGVSVRMVDGGGAAPATSPGGRVPPDVSFGCVTESGAPRDDCWVEDEGPGSDDRRMRLAVARPSREWTEWMGGLMDEVGVEGTLVVTLEVGQHLVRQRGWRGTKEIELGTSHVRKLPWLTSLDAPVSVLQLTGALVDRDGRATRIGAEGILARRTSLILSGFGAQALMTEEDVQRVLTVRREDLPGQPLVWQAGLRALVAQLTGLLSPL